MNESLTKSQEAARTTSPEEADFITLSDEQFNNKKSQIEEAKRVRKALESEGLDKGEMQSAIAGLDEEIKQSTGLSRNEAYINIYYHPETVPGMRVYTSPSGETVVEDVVFFAEKGIKGEQELLSAKGQPVAVNADLWESRQPIKPRWALNRTEYWTIPATNGGGAFTGLIRLADSPKNQRS